MKESAIFFIGPQGSGKGTQAKILSEKLGFFYWGMGDILREMAQTPTDTGRHIKQLVDGGVLLDDATLLEASREKLETLAGETGIVFDGIPRRIGQAEYLIEHLKNIGKNSAITIFLDVTREESKKRLLNRAKIEGRADDTPDAIEFRLSQYEEETVPVLEYLKKHTAFVDIDGNPSIEEVTKEIDAALSLYE